MSDIKQFKLLLNFFSQRSNLTFQMIDVFLFYFYLHLQSQIISWCFKVQILFKILDLIFEHLYLLSLLTDLQITLVLCLLMLLLFLIQSLAQLVINCLQIL